MDLAELKRLHDKAYLANQQTRETAANDLVFYYITQWDDAAMTDSSLLYRGEFNILKKAGRQIITDLEASPVQIDFEAKHDDNDSGADTLDGIYRAVDRDNSTIEAYEVAQNEAVICGFGAWEDCTQYESLRNGNDLQEIRKKPIYEANNKVFFDPNDYSLDKSESRYVSVLEAYSEDGYKDLVEELTGERPTTCDPSFADPDTSYSFPWYVKNQVVYVTRFFWRKKVKDTILTMIDPVGIQVELYESQLKDVMDDMMDGGFIILGEKDVERWEVTLYIASGQQILSEEVIAGELLPIVPVYGEHAVVEDCEHWEGITRLAKDPQRLRNFQMSYLADMLSLSPRPKPTFFAEQIAGFEHMYEDNNAYPYYLLHRKSPTGEDLPLGPLNALPEAQVPQSLALSIQLSREAVEDVAQTGVPTDIADTDLSGKAVIALQNRVDQQSMVYKSHMKHAKRRDAEVFVGMASAIYDTPRKVKIALPDGQTKTIEIMQEIVDQKTGKVVKLNDISSGQFDVYSTIGPSYASSKQQTRDELIQLMTMMGPQDPMRTVLMLKYIQLVDGHDFEDVREYARKQALLQGFKQPETPEEQQLVAQAAQGQQKPDPMMMAAMAEMEKAKAAQMREQRQAQSDQIDAQVKLGKNQIDMYDAQTDRMEALIKAEETNAKITNLNADTTVKRVNATQSVVAQFRGQLRPRPGMPVH